jgi:hypothetical protein
VYRHHLHQVGVAFETQLAHVATAAGGAFVLLFGEMAEQRVLAVEQGPRVLQKFGQVEQIGQHALAVAPPGSARARLAARPEQPRRNVEVGEQAAQHRQHALSTPTVAVTAKLQHARFPRQLVLVERDRVRASSARA